jgi:hypothetical protein
MMRNRNDVISVTFCEPEADQTRRAGSLPRAPVGDLCSDEKHAVRAGNSATGGDDRANPSRRRLQRAHAVTSIGIGLDQQQRGADALITIFVIAGFAAAA